MNYKVEYVIHYVFEDNKYTEVLRYKGTKEEIRKWLRCAVENLNSNGRIIYSKELIREQSVIDEFNPIFYRSQP